MQDCLRKWKDADFEPGNKHSITLILVCMFYDIPRFQNNDFVSIVSYDRLTELYCRPSEISISKKVNAVYSPLDRSKRFTLFALPGRPVHSDTNSASPGSSHAEITRND